MNSKIILDLSSNKPSVTLFYKGSKLCKTPLAIRIKSLLKKKPKRKDDTYEQRMEKWEISIKNRASEKVTALFADKLFNDELNEDTPVELVF